MPPGTTPAAVRSRVPWYVTFLAVLACPSSASAQIDYAAIRATKVVEAIQIEESIVLDGRLDEAAWARAPIAHDFYQQEPSEGALATEPSEVRFVYDADAIYVGGTFHDTDPRGGVINELKRDFSPRDGDTVSVIFDPFLDLNAWSFQVNPAGALRDVQMYDDSRQVNANWDTVWWVKTAKFDGGWTMEMKIPFKSLRFPETDEQVWGVNVFRLIRRRNEVTYWSPQPRQYGPHKPSYAGRLTGLRGVRPGRNLYVKPFYTGTASNLALPTINQRRDADGGLDVKYGVTPASVLDVTFRTDFSQVEVDEQQINLTRFSLFFPEKREFFLENQGAFRIGDLDSSGQSSAARRDLLPFFSRRIGLSAEGQPVPIWGGVRLTGREGAYSLGLLNIQTGAFGGRSGENVTATRIARNYGASSIGGFYLGREGSGTTGFNRVGGGEVHVNFRQGIDFNGFAMGSASSGGLTGTAGRAAFNLSESGYSVQASYTNISPRFRDDLGFFPRGDIGLTTWDAARIVRPKGRGEWLRSYSFGTSGEVFENSGHDGLLSRHLRANAEQNLRDGTTFETNLDWNYELLTAPFEVSRDVFIPPGEYRFRQLTHAFSSNKSSRLSGTFGYTGGEFYSGDIRGLSGGFRLRVDEHLAASANYSKNDVTLPQTRFTTDLARFRVDFSFSTTMFLNAFVQYNSATRTWLTNVRYRLVYRPLSDLYLVFNNTNAAGRPDQRTIAIKHTILLSF